LWIFLVNGFHFDFRRRRRPPIADQILFLFWAKYSFFSGQNTLTTENEKGVF
jgi:hypothetical protein